MILYTALGCDLHIYLVFLYHEDSGLSYLPNGLKILGGRKMKTAVIYNTAQYVLMLLISERMDEWMPGYLDGRMDEAIQHI